MACQMNASSTNVGSGVFWKMLCQYTLWPVQQKQGSIRDLTEGSAACVLTRKADSFMKERSRCSRKIKGWVIRNHEAAADISNEVDSQEVKEKQSVICIAVGVSSAEFP